MFLVLLLKYFIINGATLLCFSHVYRRPSLYPHSALWWTEHAVTHARFLLCLFL